MIRLIVSIAATFSLAACQSTGPHGCPPLINYSAAVQKQAAAEIRAGHSPTLNEFVTDYGKMRDACRITLQ
jgi:hypothetical protein